jgi:hypothetical protein
MENQLSQPMQAAESSQPPAPTSTPQKIGKWRGGLLIAKQSFALLKKDKEILLFPILSSVCTIILSVLFFIVIFIFFISGNGDALAVESAQTTSLQETIFIYGALFVLYIIGAFIVAFFQAGLVTIVHARINGQDFTFRDGMQNAIRNSKKIFLWAVVTATVGIVLRFIADRSEWLGRLIAFFLGAAWGIVTFFIVPVLALEDLSIKDSIKRSAGIFRATWGETLVVNFSVGILFFLILLGGATLYVLSLFTASWAVIIITSVLFVLFLIVLSLISSTLNTIFIIALYEYAAHQKSSEYFTPELLSGAIGKKL